MEREEQLREEAGMYNYKVPELSETMREIKQLAKQIRDKKIIMREEARIMKASTKPIMPRTATAKVRDRSVAKLKEQMEDLGVDMEDTENVSVNIYIEFKYDQENYLEYIVVFLLLLYYCVLIDTIAYIYYYCDFFLIRHISNEQEDDPDRIQNLLVNACVWNQCHNRVSVVCQDHHEMKWVLKTWRYVKKDI